ncbi:MAG: PEP-CTERM sorting domain-containing protein [Candidatus Wallbacteria bacterium]|nr:PEP-CTERM sorting domain-containing protein [Candidatus Wallbacteria bacterium]
MMHSPDTMLKRVLLLSARAYHVALLFLACAGTASAQGGGVGGGVGAVPEPATWTLIALAAGGYALRHRRDR